MNTTKICKIVNESGLYVMYVDQQRMLIGSGSVPEYFKNHYLEYGYTVILDTERPEVENRTPTTLIPTSNRWIKMDENTTIITTALTNITSIYRNGNDVTVYSGSDNCESVFPTPAEAEAFLDEILAKIDRL